MKVDKRSGSGVAKIHIEDDGSYFQVTQVSSSPDGQTPVFAAPSSHRYGDHGTFRCHESGQIHCRHGWEGRDGAWGGGGGAQRQNMELRGELFLQMVVPVFPSLSPPSVSSNSVRFSS